MLNNECYFLSGRKCHFHRYSDSTFRNKWTGFWIGNMKFLDYFAFQVNDEWLSPENISNFKFNGFSASSEYETKFGTVMEKIEMTDGELIQITLELPKKMKIISEFGINIRRKSENWHSRSYEIISDGSNVYKFLSIDSISISFDKKTSIAGTFYKNHMEDQRCMVVKFSSEQKKLKISIFREPRVVKIKRKFKNDVLGYASLSLDMLIKENGMYAGLPWFLETWGRDLGWTIPALIDLKWFNEARKLLDLMLSKSKENVPNFLNPPDYFSADATPLIIIALKKYIDSTNDESLLKKHWSKISNFIDWYEKNSDESGFFENDMKNLFDPARGSTWMDTLHRPKAIEVQALWHKALGDLKELGFEVENKIDIEKYWNGRYYIDNGKDNQSITPNMLVPVVLGISKHPKEVLSIVEEKLSTPWGILTLPRDDPKFSFSKYHQGQIWSLTTGWMALAEFMYGDKGDYYLNILSKSQKICHPGVGETFDDQGNILGCKVQAWGSAMIVRAIKEFKEHH